MKCTTSVWILSLWFASVCLGYAAEGGWEGQSLSLTLENDAIAAEDRHYTQGAWIRYWSRDDAMPQWLKSFSDAIPAVQLEVEARKWGLAFGQEIYTPEDLRATEVIKDDRPYAGWLYASAGLQRRGQVSDVAWAMEQFRLDLGIVGPESLAEETQKTWHNQEPAGWDHQLNSEPGFAARYERRYLLRLDLPDTRWSVDLLPGANAAVGNVDTHLGAGGEMRFGYNVPNEFAVPTEQRPWRWGFYLFTGLEGRWVMRNIFLDGNTFRSSHRVDKKSLTAQGSLGATFVLKQVEISFSHNFRSREFEDQQTSDSYGSITALLKF